MAEPELEPKGCPRPSHSAGFTLLEVIVAVFIFSLVMGLLISLVSENLAKLSRARDQLVAGELGEKTLREVAERMEGGETVSTESGKYQEPFEYMRYEVAVEPYTVPVPEGVKPAQPPLSTVFAPAARGGAGGTPLRLIVVRVFREGSPAEGAIPLVGLVGPPRDQAPGAADAGNRKNPRDRTNRSNESGGKDSSGKSGRAGSGE